MTYLMGRNVSPKISNNFFEERVRSPFKNVFDRSFIHHFSHGAAGLPDKA